MNWYLAKIVFRIICGDGNHTAQFDEQLRLVRATDKEEALQKARSWGKAGEEKFLNNNRQMVHWQFINIIELFRLSELIDGAEIYSRIEEKDNGDNYVQWVNQKADMIRSGHTPELLELV